MAYPFVFEKLLSYDVGEPGITLQATLKLKEHTLDLPVKVDTGASCCLFERRVGDALGFDIETGMRQLFGTATGTFVGYGHEVTLSVAEFEIRDDRVLSLRCRNCAQRARTLWLAGPGRTRLG